jgi:purine-nucleoside phosphorylase
VRVLHPPDVSLPSVSTHIGAAAGEIAPLVLFPGDPLRAKWIAETFLDDARCYSEVRGMLGFTGRWRGEPVSVQGSGMGQPSMAIYATELFRDYGVQSIIRVGSAGALTEKVKVRDIVIASGACTDSGMNRVRFEGLDYAPVADFGLLSAAYAAAGGRDDVHVGLIFSGDSFYPARPELLKRMVEHGVLAIEMEASALYTIAAGHGRRALAICTVSDHIVTGEETSAAERERTFGDMVELALMAGTA